MPTFADFTEEEQNKWFKNKEKMEAFKKDPVMSMQWLEGTGTVEGVRNWFIEHDKKLIEAAKEETKGQGKLEFDKVGGIVESNPTKVEYVPWYRTEALELIQKHPKYKGMIDVLTYEQVTLDDLLNELYHHPIGSPLYATIRNCIVEKLTEPKYDDYVIAFMSRMNLEYPTHKRRQDLEEFNDLEGIEKYPVEGTFTHDNNLTNTVYFSKELSFLEDDRFVIMPRKYLEHNPEFKQIVVAGYITDGKDIMLLHANSNKDNRIRDKYTMIQGHVDFGPRVYTEPQLGFLYDSMLREFTEEVDFKGPLTFETTPKYFINDKGHRVGLEHFGVIYEIRVPSVEDLKNSIKSGEEDKHSVVVIKNGTYSDFFDNFDDWTKKLFNELNK